DPVRQKRAPGRLLAGQALADDQGRARQAGWPRSGLAGWAGPTGTARGQLARVDAGRLAAELDRLGPATGAGQPREVEPAGVDVLRVGEQLPVRPDDQVEDAAAVALALELAAAGQDRARVGDRLVGAHGQGPVDLVEQAAR